MEKYDQLLISLRQVIRAIGMHSKQLNKKSGLTGPQLMVMTKIAQLDGPMAKKVAKEINLSPATVTSIIDRLEAKELVVRKRSQLDKRRVELYISSTGEERLQDAPKPLQEHFIKRYQALESWEQSQLLTSVERIASMMDAEELDAAPVLMVGQIQEEQ